MISVESFSSIINGYLPEPHSSLLNGILFGINLKSTADFYRQLQTVGLLHLVVLSGMNISILAAVVSSITQRLGKRLSILLTILIIILFVLFVGLQAPIVRAAVMGMLTLVAILKGRKITILYSLFLSLIFIAIFFPKWLTGISLQLSYGATLGIILFGKTVSKNKIVKDFKITLAAQIFTTPVIFFNFRQISLISPLSNLLVSFLIGPLMIFGFASVILGRIHPLLGLLPSYICYGILSYIIWVIDFLSGLPFVFIQF